HAPAHRPPHPEGFPVRLRSARQLKVVPAADALTLLRIFDHRVLPVNLVLPLEVVHICRGPVAIQRRSDLLLCHIRSPRPSPSTLSRVACVGGSRPATWGRRAIPSGKG